MIYCIYNGIILFFYFDTNIYFTVTSLHYINEMENKTRGQISSDSNECNMFVCICTFSKSRTLTWIFIKYLVTANVYILPPAAPEGNVA